MKVERIYNKNGSYEKNCPNCGAAIEGEKCPYCGTVFIDFACVEIDKPFWLKLKVGDRIYKAYVRLDNAQFVCDYPILECTEIRDTVTRYIQSEKRMISMEFETLEGNFE